MNVPSTAIVIQPDDRLTISVFGVPDYQTDARVERDGTLPLPYLGSVALAGLSVTAAEQKIAAALKTRDLLKDPAVKVVVAEQPSSLITVSGEVAKPGAYPAVGEHTLGEALAQAGGMLSTASPVVEVVRRGLPAPIAVPLGPDPSSATDQMYARLPLVAGDVVRVSKVGVYYIVGAVKTQGAYPLKNATPTTVTQALAAAGGYGFEAILDSAMIARTQGDTRILLKVHAGKILHGKESDVALLNDDILFVPTSQLKAAVKGGGTGLIVSLASTYLYTHP